MKYPMINKKPQREVDIPSLTGGLNLRDGISHIKDNQMTDCVNMWFKDGMLRTRPGLVALEDSVVLTQKLDLSTIVTGTDTDTDTDADATTGITDIDNTNTDTSIDISNNIYSTHAIKVHNEIKDAEGRTLVSYSYIDKKSDENYSYYNIKFMWHSAKEIKEGQLLKITVARESGESTTETLPEKNINYSDPGIGNGYFTVEKDGVIYVAVYFMDKYFYKKWEYEKEESSFATMDDLEDFYAPVVIIEDKQMRGYNLFGGRYRGRYEFNTTEVKTRFDLPSSIPKNSRVRIWGTVGYEGVYEFTSDDDTEEITKEYLDGKLKIKVVRDKQSYIQFLTAEGKAVDTIGELSVDLKGGYFQYNSVCDVSEDMNKVFGMQQSIYYGVGAEGISGGTRLFLGDNRAGKERNLVMWSSLNNPLYWPVNNYAYIGDKSQAVTGFGKQGENLIIFKEKSSYYSYGVTNTDISEEDIINQSVIDLESNTTYFVIKQFNDSIGCDLPNTIALCNNRLVWACTNGCVYTLVSNNQYSERTIFKVSEMIEPRLKKERSKFYTLSDSLFDWAIEYAYAFDCGDHYCLNIDNRMYVMDYNSYGFRYITSYLKNDDSNAQIPWYYWEFPSFRKMQTVSAPILDEGIHTVMSADGNIIFISSYFEENNLTRKMALAVDVLDLNDATGEDVYSFISKGFGIDSESKVIESSFKTKIFDFGAARYVKNIEGVSVGFGNNGGIPITVEFVTSSGNDSEEILIVSDDTDERDNAFITYRNFYPSIRSVRTFGVMISCSGQLLIDGINIRYRVLGGIR